MMRLPTCSSIWYSIKVQPLGHKTIGHLQRHLAAQLIVGQRQINVASRLSNPLQPTTDIHSERHILAEVGKADALMASLWVTRRIGGDGALRADRERDARLFEPLNPLRIQVAIGKDMSDLIGLCERRQGDPPELGRINERDH